MEDGSSLSTRARETKVVISLYDPQARVEADGVPARLQRLSRMTLFVHSSFPRPSCLLRHEPHEESQSNLKIVLSHLLSSV